MSEHNGSESCKGWVGCLACRDALIQRGREDFRRECVDALRNHCAVCRGDRWVHEHDGSEEGYQAPCPQCHNSDLYDLADRMESHAFPPPPKEGT